LHRNSDAWGVNWQFAHFVGGAEMKLATNPTTLKALKLYLKELQKISMKYKKQRVAEIAKIEAKFGAEISADELADMYGYKQITKAEYDTALDALEQNGNAKEAAKDLKTPLSEVVRIIASDIRNIETEITEIERG
ncbi:MAG: hypothetical protein RR910_08160, partial [Acidaminococcaceae bacterium]